MFFNPPEGKFLPLGEISTRPKGKIFKNLPLEETFFRSSEDISEEFRDLNTFEAKKSREIETAMNYSKKNPLRGLSGLQVLFLSEHWSYLNLCELNWNTTKNIREMSDITMVFF